jgi:asparagine synthase (glutamine-hydrolysing)
LPVYFSFKNNNLDVFYESNSYKKKSFSLSKRKIKELESSGATLGRNSIAKGFYSLNPGEMLAINLKSKKFIIRKYFSFKYQFTNLEKDRHFNKIDETFNKIFLSLRSIAKDRRILIPLSGGYDSRLIACQLKKHHFKNILAFTYGSSDKSSEAIISKKIADNLNIPWVFIKYDNKSWDKQSDYEFSKYLNSTFDFSSLPHYQDFLAIYFAKQRGILKDDDILMPGHSGDMLAGSHFLKIDDGRFYELSDVAKMLEQDIFNFKKNKLHRVIRSHLFLNSGKKNDTGINCQVNAMKLDFELRQSKYIINSVRVYEYFDIDWWLPLWDIRLVD